MAYVYGIHNRYVPSLLIKKAYGWGAVQRNMADVPDHLMATPSGMSAEQFQQQFAYEWLESRDVTPGFSNPPFVSGAAGRLLPSIKTMTGVPARIQRGFIRRGEVEAGTPTSRARLYFMYNPDSITRDYVSYLDQTALDPFNTVYQSGNLVAPPSILDFNFSLFFDRQEEATDPLHPGVFVDYQFFDLVVRNVVPDDPNSTGNTLPDNGVMMVNPREITVVFSQQISVQGRPLNARVSFLQFTHRMVPTRMQIDMTIRATYLGPLKPQTEYTAEEFVAADSIPIGEGLKLYQFTNQDIEDAAAGSIPTVDATGATIEGAAGSARLAALQYAINHTVSAAGATSKAANTQPGVTKYGGVEKREYAMVGTPPNQIFDYVDCSSYVVRSYRSVGASAGLGWGTYGDGSGSKNTSQIIAQVRKTDARFPKKLLSEAGAFEWLKPGDLLIREDGFKGESGHIVFVYETKAPDQVVICGAQNYTVNPQVGIQKAQSFSKMKYEYAFRPMPTGWTSQVANTGGNSPQNAGGHINPSNGSWVPD